jgi:uncharacterized coiled-coil protein SlyX
LILFLFLLLQERLITELQQQLAASHRVIERTKVIEV